MHDTLKLLLATTNLGLIPKSISLLIKGLQYILSIIVISWIEEAFIFFTISDTTPPESVYEDVARDVYAHMMSRWSPASSSGSA
jgi:hypothetical protein